MPASLHPVSLKPVPPAKFPRLAGRTVALALTLVACLALLFYARPVMACALALCLGVVCYWRPLWVIDQSIRAWLRLHGVRSQYIHIGFFRVHYLAGGRGLPLVLVHGLEGSAENWFRLMPPLLRNGYRVYALDLLGFGRSDRPDVNYSISRQAEILAQFFDSQGLARADLGGWSMGGWVALQFALAHPERVRRIFLADSAGITFDIPFESTLFYPQTVEQARELLALLTPLGYCTPRFVARDIVRHVSTRTGIAQRCMQSMMAGEDLLDGRLAGIRVPVLIVWGKQDAIIPLHCGAEMHHQFAVAAGDL